jgi:hypothetical protein
MLISTALLLDSIIRNSVCTPAKLPCRRVEVGYEKKLTGTGLGGNRIFSMSTKDTTWPYYFCSPGLLLVADCSLSQRTPLPKKNNKTLCSFVQINTTNHHKRCTSSSSSEICRAKISHCRISSSYLL